MTMTLTAAGTIAGVAASASTVTYTIFGDEFGTTDSFKKLAQGQLPAAAATIYTVPGSTSSIVKSIVLDNTSGVSQLVSMFMDGTAATNRIGSFTIPAGGNATWTASGWSMHDTTGALLGTTALPAQANNTFTGNISGGSAPPVGLTQVQATALLNLATSTLPGTMSAAQFKKLLGYVDVVADWGFVGDGSTDNLAAWNTFKAGVAANSIVYFPAGTYNFSAEATLDQDKHLQFHGAGEFITTLRTTSTTANLINVTGTGGNAWYNTFTDLGFGSTVTKTAGALLAFTVAAAISCDIRRCAFNGHFIAIDFQGAQAGNVTVLDDLSIGTPAVNGRGVRINGNTINMVLVNSTINSGPNTFAVAGSANVEVNQSGAVQILGCDLIGGANSLLLNANQGGGTSIAAIYVTNTFFDQSNGSTVKITGANTTNRIKFMQCGIAAGGTGSTNAVEIAGTGSGAVGSATAMPAGISFVDCDVYYAPGGSTASGFLINGCQDVNIQNTRVAGFSGAGGAGIHVIPSNLNQTRVRINGCRIGPNSNLTINNLVGIQLDLGSSGLGALSITDNDLGGNGTAIVDNSTIAAGSYKNIANNFGALNGLNNSLPSAAGIAITATEQVVAQIAAPANSLKVGTTFRFMAVGTCAVTSTLIARIHIGTAGSVADAQILSSTSAAGVAGAFVLEGEAVITAVGAAATAAGEVRFSMATSTTVPTATFPATTNSTVANFISFGLASSATGHTVRAATLEIISPS
jgi:hypothetical protein